MKHFNKSLAAAALLVATGMAFTACDDWTEPKSLDIDYGTIDKDPNYQAYLQALRAYRTTDHTKVYAWIDCPADGANSQGDRLMAMPDSIDVIVLQNPGAVSDLTWLEMQQARQLKGQKIMYTIDYSAIATDYAKIAELATEENPAPTLTDYVVSQLSTQLAYAQREGFDGVMFGYDGKYTGTLSAAEKAELQARENLFFGVLADWHKRFPQFEIDFFGTPQYVSDATLLDDFGYLFLRQGLDATNADLFNYYLTLSGLPAQRVGMMSTATSFIESEAKVGYFADGSYALDGLALWAAANKVGALGILRASNDYYNTGANYAHVRKVIQAANPAVK